MRRLIIAATAALLIVTIPLAATAGSTRLQARLQPTGDSNIRGTAMWSAMSEQAPIYLSLRGAQPSSRVVVRVCGPTINGETGVVYDQCWATFVDADRHLMDIGVDSRGRANVALYPKLGVGPTVLTKAERLEVYASGDMTAPISVGELRGWGMTVRSLRSIATAWRR